MPDNEQDRDQGFSARKFGDGTDRPTPVQRKTINAFRYHGYK